MRPNSMYVAREILLSRLGSGLPKVKRRISSLAGIPASVAFMRSQSSSISLKRTG